MKKVKIGNHLVHIDNSCQHFGENIFLCLNIYDKIGFIVFFILFF